MEVFHQKLYGRRDFLKIWIYGEVFHQKLHGRRDFLKIWINGSISQETHRPVQFSQNLNIWKYFANNSIAGAIFSKSGYMEVFHQKLHGRRDFFKISINGSISQETHRPVQFSQNLNIWKYFTRSSAASISPVTLSLARFSQILDK